MRPFRSHRLQTLPCRLLFLVMFLPAACNDAGPERKFDRYLSRLERTLATPGASPAVAAMPVMPRPGSLQIQLQASKLDTLDFLSLSGCAVQVTIGKRNSSLGRMARASQQLLLDLEYLQLAPDCADDLRNRGNDQLAETLESAWRLKRRQLPGRMFNATLASAEYRQFWRPPNSLAGYPQYTSTAVVTALAAINQSVRSWLEGDYQFDNRDFEILLSEVATGDGGALLQALQLQSDQLAAADLMLADRLQRRQHSTFSRNEAEADILANVVAKFFIGEIQPWSAGVDRRRQLLLPEVRELEQLLSTVLPGNYRRWQQQRDQALLSWSGAPRRHVQSLQALRSALVP